jgi:antitoxin (DNA-binding transcriptional repressor) of toxin-antitoxin stability system
MSKTITQRELRNHSGEIMRGLDQGEEFIVTRNGIAVGELRPLRPRYLERGQLIEAFRSAPALDAQRFRKDVDRVLDQAVEPRS